MVSEKTDATGTNLEYRHHQLSLSASSLMSSTRWIHLGCEGQRSALFAERAFASHRRFNVELVFRKWVRITTKSMLPCQFYRRTTRVPAH